MRYACSRAALAAFVVTVGCTADRIVSPDVSAGHATADVIVPIAVGSVEATILYKGQAVGYNTTGCGSFVFQLKNVQTGLTYSLFQNCGSFANAGPASAHDLPVGDYHLRFAYGSFTPSFGQSTFELVTPIDLTVTTAATTSVSFDVSDRVGKVRGEVLVNGLPPTNLNYNVNLTNDARGDLSAFTNVQPAVSPLPPGTPNPGSYRMLLPPGAATGRVSSMIGGTLATFHTTVTVGETADVASIDAGGGTVEATILYKGQAVAYNTTGCGSFAYQLKNVATGLTYSLFQNCGSFAGPGPATARDVPVGNYRLRLAYGSFTPVFGQAILELGTPIDFAVTGGGTSSLSFDVSAQVGQVRGQVLVNGQPPSNLNYNVNLTNDARNDISAFTNVQPTVPPPVPAGTPDPGSYRMLLPPGAATGRVSSMIGGTLATFHATVTAGETSDLASIEAGGGTVEASILYKGQTVGYNTTGCGSFVFQLKNVSTGLTYSLFQNCGSFAAAGPATARDVPVGNYRLRMAYGSFTPVLGQPIAELATPIDFAVTGGGTSKLSFDVSDKVGQVRGQVLINGQPPTNLNYNVSLTNDARNDVSAFTNVQPVVPPPIPPGTPDAGSFRILFPGGAATGRVSSMIGGLLATFHINVTPGSDLDIGNALSAGSLGLIPKTAALVAGWSNRLTITRTGALETPLPVSLTTSSGLFLGEPSTSNSIGGGQTGTFTMAAGVDSKPIILVGVLGPPQTVIAAAANYKPDTATFTFVKGTILVSGWPTSLAVGDSAPVQISAADQNGNFSGNLAFTTIFSLQGSGLVFRQDQTTLTSIPIPLRTSAVFYVKATSGGPATATISSPDYVTYTATLNNMQRQNVAFTSQPPSPPLVGGTYAVSATGGGSNSPVSFSTQTPSVCAISGSVVSFVAAGSCRVAADQAGGPDYLAADQRVQDFTILAPVSQRIAFTSAAPNPAFVGGTYAIAATGGASANPVTFSGLTPAVCRVNGASVALVGVGQCRVAADQAGGGIYLAAPQAVQEFGVLSPDDTPPVITPTVVGTSGANGWYTSNVTVSWSVDDDESAITSSTGCGSGAVTANGDGQTFTCTATSTGGSATKSVTIKRDATVPTVTATPSGTQGTGGWYTSDVSVAWSTSPAGPSGLTATCPVATQTTDTPGQTFDCTATTGAGLRGAGTITIKRDASPPVVIGTPSGTPGAGGWYVSDVGITWTTSDRESGIVTTAGCDPNTLSRNAASQTYTCSATNGAGVLGNGTVTVKRDDTRPVITPTVSGTLGLAGWYVSNVTVTWDVATGPSGVASSTGCTNAAQGTDTGVSGTTVTCSATSGAGLSATASQTVNRDATAPVIAYTGNNGTYTVDQAVTISCVATDAVPGSGLASTTCANVSGPAFSFALGINSVSAAALDNASNAGSATTSFTVAVSAGSLCNLVRRFISDQGVANSLCVKLDHGTYGSFRNEVSAQTGKKINQTDAAILQRLVNALPN